MLTTELTRSDVEDFLFDEAELLSAWRWDDWLALFVEGARYEIPTFDARDLDGRVAQFFISDDWPLLQARITRMKSWTGGESSPPPRRARTVTRYRPGFRRTLRRTPRGPGAARTVVTVR